MRAVRRVEERTRAQMPAKIPLLNDAVAKIPDVPVVLVKAAPISRGGGPSAAPSFMSTAGALLVLCAAVAAATFLEPDQTRNDFERFADQRLLILFLGLFVGLGLVFARVAMEPPALHRRTVIAVALIALGVLLAGMPVGSRDLYLYAFYGKMWAAYGTNPYVQTPADFPVDAWQPYVQMQWSRRHMIYGPLFLWQTRAAGAWAGDNLFVALWTFKVVAALALVAVWWLVSRIESNGYASGAGTLLLVAWNPLLLFEAAGNGHNDVVMLLLVTAAVWCWQREQPLAAAALIALSFWYKWYGAVLLPVFAVAALRQHGLRLALRLAGLSAVVILVTGILSLYSVPGAAAVISGELRDPLALSQIYPTELSPLLAPWFWLLHATGLLDRAHGLELFHSGRVLLFAAVSLATVVRQWWQPPSLAVLIESSFLVSLAFTMFLVTILWPWHLMVPITLGLLTCRPAFVAVAVALTIAGLLSYFLTFAVATLGLVLIAGALTLLRRRRGSAMAPHLDINGEIRGRP
jgi:hypothetical protein